MNKKSIISLFIAFALVVTSITIGTISLTAEAATVPNVTVSYRTHVQTYGWQPYVSNGAMAGTSGESKRLEGINIKVDGNKNLGIQYTTHVQTYGWMPWSRNNEMSGTSGESKRLEAIKIQLIGNDKDKYDVYYRVHAQHYGWMGWAKNGQAAGTAGFAYRLEGINIVVVKKGSTFDGTKYEGGKCWIDTPYIENNTNKTDISVDDANTPTVMYQPHVQSIGWQKWLKNGELGGTTQNLRFEAIKVQLRNKPYSGGITYQLHVQTYGWMPWVSDGEIGGTQGEAKRVEGIKINLTGNMAKYYDVVYRTYIENIGWQDWKKNGEMSGTEGRALKLEGIEIKLVKKETKKTTTETTEETTEKPANTEKSANPEKPSNTEKSSITENTTESNTTEKPSNTTEKTTTESTTETTTESNTTEKPINANEQETSGYDVVTYQYAAIEKRTSTMTEPGVITQATWFEYWVYNSVCNHWTVKDYVEQNILSKGHNHSLYQHYEGTENGKAGTPLIESKTEPVYTWGQWTEFKAATKTYTQKLRWTKKNGKKTYLDYKSVEDFINQLDKTRNTYTDNKTTQYRGGGLSYDITLN